MVLFAYAMYAMLYLLLSSGVYFLLPSDVYIMYYTASLRDALSLAWLFTPALDADANPESASEYGRTSLQVA